MKKLVTGMIIVGLIGMMAWTFAGTKTVILGKVNPPDGAELVWVLGEKDSLKSGISSGQFYFDVKPGKYKLLVDALPPYKDVLLENLVVAQDETIDVGEIILKQ